MSKLTLSDMKATSRDLFFSRGAMRFFKGAKYSTHYDKERDKNFIIVKSPYNTYGYHEFDETSGKTEPVEHTDVWKELDKDKQWKKNLRR